MLDADEFALAMHLMNIKLDGNILFTITIVQHKKVVVFSVT